MRNRPTSELARMRAHFIEQGWNPDDLAQFRMQDDGAPPDQGQSSDDGGSGESGDKSDGSADNLGEAGKAAIAKERKTARDAKKALKPWQSIGDEYNLSPDEVRDALAKLNDSSSDDHQVDVDKVRREAEQTAREKADDRILRAEVRALAAETFADPTDAIPNVDLTQFEVSDDGNVDTGAIKAELADVLQRKPHLAKGGKKPIPDPSQGSKGAGKKESTPGLGRLRDAYAASSK